MFEDRVNFCTAVKYTLNVGELSTKKIYAFLEKKKVNKIYMDIINKITDE
jgi:hypothetical protein